MLLVLSGTPTTCCCCCCQDRLLHVVVVVVVFRTAYYMLLAGGPYPGRLSDHGGMTQVSDRPVKFQAGPNMTLVWPIRDSDSDQCSLPLLASLGLKTFCPNPLILKTPIHGPFYPDTSFWVNHTFHESYAFGGRKVGIYTEKV